MTEYLEFTCPYCAHWEIEYAEKSTKVVKVPVDDEIIYELDRERRYFRCYGCEEPLELNGKVVTTAKQLRRFLRGQAKERKNETT